MPVQRQAIHFQASLAHHVLQGEYLGDDDDGDDKTSHTVLAIHTVMRFLHEDTHTQAQQVVLLSV